MYFGSNLLNFREINFDNQDGIAAALQPLLPDYAVNKQLISKWEKRKDGPSQEVVDAVAKLMRVDPVDLVYRDLAQKGTSDRESNGTVSLMIPFYDAVAIAGFGIMAEQTPVSKPKHMINPGTFFRNAEGALQITGHSMFPKYPSGCIVAYRQASLALILWGEDYVIELEEDRRLILKRIEKSENKDCIKAVSYNVNKDNKYVYDPIDVPIKQIGRIFMVLGMIQLEAMQI